MSNNLLTIILAAGQGTRMKSDLTKVLHKVGGQPMVGHVVDLTLGLGSRVVVVVGHQSEKVEKTLNNDELIFVKQKEQLGTAHAVIQAKEYIEEHDGPILILYGDTPLLTRETLKRLVEKQNQSKAGAVVLTAYVENPYGYGRIVRNNNDQIIKIVEEKDADEREKKIKEINSGVYTFDSKLLQEALDNIDCDNAQGEYYLTDAISYINKKGEKVLPVIVNNNEEITGINDRKNLAKAEKIIRKRINDKHMERGVTIIDPDTTYIDKNVEIGPDTIIYPFTFIEGDTRIGAHSVIGPHSRIVNGIIGDGVVLKSNTNIWESEIKEGATVGPFAYIRPGCIIGKDAKVGDFVELKKAYIGQKSKVPHLSYVGDAQIGTGTNIGAGTIFANYDGKNKNQTIVGDSVFIGSNSTLVAPVKIGNKGKTGAGSVVLRDVKDNETVVGVPARTLKEKGEN